MKHASEIFITEKICIILYCDPKSPLPDNYWIVGLDNNMQTFIERDLTKAEAKQLFEWKVQEAKG